MPAWYLRGLRSNQATALPLQAVATTFLCLTLTASPVKAADSDLFRSPSRPVLESASPLQGDILLPADQAFALQVKQQTDNSFILQWEIKEGYYLYRDKMTITAAVDGINIGSFPAGEVTHDEYFGDVEIYRNELHIGITGQDVDGDVEITINLQGCADNRYCYPPDSRQITLPF